VAVFAAILSAFFTVINAHVINGKDPATLAFYEMGFAAVAIWQLLPDLQVNVDETL